MIAAIGILFSGGNGGSGVDGISWPEGGKGIGGGDGGLEGAQQELMDNITMITSVKLSNLSEGRLLNFGRAVIFINRIVAIALLLCQLPQLNIKASDLFLQEASLASRILCQPLGTVP